MHRAASVLATITRLDIDSRLAAIAEKQVDAIADAIDAAITELGPVSPAPRAGRSPGRRRCFTTTPSCAAGRRAEGAVDYTPTEPLLVVEVDADVCFEQGRWRQAFVTGATPAITSGQVLALPTPIPLPRPTAGGAASSPLRPLARLAWSRRRCWSLTSSPGHRRRCSP